MCACMHDVFVCVTSGGEAAADEDRQDKEKKKAVVGDKVLRIKINSHVLNEFFHFQELLLFSAGLV